MKYFLLILFFAVHVFGADAPPNRVASLLLSEEFINQQIEKYSKPRSPVQSRTKIIQSMKVMLEPSSGNILLRGLLQVPIEELRAVNLDPKLGAFRFQVSIKPEMTKDGYFVLDFPLNETYFYPATSKGEVSDRIIVPVQMISLALASVRGYLAALSGDFSGFDRRTEKLEALLKDVNHLIKHEKNKDALDDLKNQRQDLKLQLEAVPVERKQLQTAAREVGKVLGFTGEKELNLNKDLGARKNALIFKIKVSQFVPYLKDVDLGGIRIVHDKRDGNGLNYLVIDVTSADAEKVTQRSKSDSSNQKGMKDAPALIVRLNQSLFETQAVLDAEKAKMNPKIKDLKLELKDDGLHVTGKWSTFLVSVPFDTILDFETTGLDTFVIKVREVTVAGMDFKFMSKFVLDMMQARFEQMMKGLCTFQYLGDESDQSKALQVTVDSAHLIPAFPELHVVDVDVREKEFLLKVGSSISQK